MSRKSAPRLALMLFVCVAVFASGSAATWLWFFPPVPSALESPRQAATARVVAHEYLDERAVELDYRSEPPIPLTAGRAGRITSVECTPGGVIESGTSFLSVDESPLIALSTAVPLWRDLRAGDTGDDVASLQAELARLGFPTRSDGTMGAATLSSITKMFAAAGEEITDGILPRHRVVWLPESTVTLASCEVRLGTTVETGGTLARTTARLTHVSLHTMPVDLVPGERRLIIESASVPIGEDGVVTEPESLDTLAMTPSMREALESDAVDRDPGASATPITARVSLSAPVTVGAVPPTAIYSISNNRGCITSSGVPYPVTIVGSQLGQTYVDVESPRPVKTVELSKKAQLPCT